MPGPEHPIHRTKPVVRAPGADEPEVVEDARKPQLDGEGKPYMTLAQFAKVQDLASTGGAAKHLVREGGFAVNGQPEDRPGRKLHAGDKVTFAGRNYSVTLA